MKNIRFIALAFATLFITISLASCSQTKEEKDAEKLVKHIKNGEYDDAVELLKELENDYDTTKKSKKFYEALDKEATSEDAIIRTAWFIEAYLPSIPEQTEEDYTD